ncbi:nitrite/sulfite reductase [Geovibrio thiophilus]|uniref:Nitrite/sulfite reductase n=1 Tax=Geovibrio thiophilus TaxID=139438 RepID=A0A410JXD5_9BACT|nr:nitrite/sulfite reductase [Geovibrio thiophilus]QAR32824.1 nitrite/sulfite reductase [Geovibrio thiophilus]
MDLYRLPEGYYEVIDSFEVVLRSWLSGGTDMDEFRKTCAGFGIYEQKQQGTFMQRIRLAGGIIDASLLGSLISLAEEYAGGFLHITTRQNVQLHDVAPENLGKLQRRLADLSLLTKTAGGNCVRNVLIDPLSGVSADDVFDVSPYGLELSNRLPEYPVFTALPRKFKIALSSSREDRALCAIADLGLIAVKRKGRRGFSVCTGGGLGAKSMTGDRLLDFIPASDILIAALAFGELFAEYGQGVPRSQARLRFLIERTGRDEFFKILKTKLKKFSDDKSLKIKRRSFSYARETNNWVFEDSKWTDLFVTPQRQTGRYTVKIPLFFGQVSADTAALVIAFCKKYPKTEIRFTQTQNILLRGVSAAILREAKGLAFGISSLAGANGFLSDIKTCVGTDFCRLSAASSSGLLKGITDAVTADKELSGFEDARIGISGCVNGCGHTALADLGFGGKAGKDKSGERADWFRIFIGGSLKGIGIDIGELPAVNIPAFTVDVLKKYKASGAVSFGDFLADGGRSEAETLLKEYL